MKKLLGVVVTLVCLSSFAETEFWSMGSFNVFANAAAEKNRISGVTGLSVQIATYTVGDPITYRVVVEKDVYPMEQRQKIMDAGVTPWSILIDSRQLSVTKAGNEEIAADRMDYFLVLGGFRREVSADLMLSRFESSGIDSLQIEEATVASAPWYRVLHGPFDAPFDTVLSALRAHGVADAWWVSKQPEVAQEPDVAIEAVKPSTRETSMVLETAMIEWPETQGAKVKVNPPNPDESYLDYCVKKANAPERAVYCEDGSFIRLVVAEKAALSKR